MGRKSRNKGVRYEREIASLLRNEYGWENERRGQQYSGANGDADVLGLPGIHIECKHQEQLKIYDWMDQAKRDARDGEIPAVFFRKNYCENLVVLRLDDFMRMYAESGLFEEAED
ncbi:MAG: putative PDDEXK endonuclease [Anaerovoracaceae bacterium]|jgi:hypothetical protein